MSDKPSNAEEFQKLAEILIAIKSTVNPKMDIVWTRFNSIDELLADLDDKTARLKLCNYKVLDEVSIMFASTGAFQELSISNGWGDYCLKLAERFDHHYKRIRSIIN